MNSLKDKNAVHFTGSASLAAMAVPGVCRQNGALILKRSRVSLSWSIWLIKKAATQLT